MWVLFVSLFLIHCWFCCFFFFFFKQKTAYEMRISDWSSDVCSSDLGLDAVAAAARSVVARTASIGMSLDTGTVPGSPKERRIADGEAELGLGIHGEPGIEKVRFAGAGAAVQLVIDRLRPHVDRNARHALLLNNLGGCTPLEMVVLAEELCRSDLAPSPAWMLGPAPLMTSLDMRGFSVSLLPLEARGGSAGGADRLRRLAAAAGAGSRSEEHTSELQSL